MKTEMTFDNSGGLAVVDLHSYGRWEIIVPWIIATEAWRIEKGDEIPNENDLRDWLRRRLHSFTDMLAARIDPSHVANSPDDPRITTRRIR